MVACRDALLLARRGSPLLHRLDGLPMRFRRELAQCATRVWEPLRALREILLLTTSSRTGAYAEGFAEESTRRLLFDRRDGLDNIRGTPGVEDLVDDCLGFVKDSGRLVVAAPLVVHFPSPVVRQ